MARAAALLARAWHRDGRRWWWAATATLALSVVAILLVSGLFAGLQVATTRQVGDFYTGDLRITKGEPGVSPDAEWAGSEVDATLQALGPGAHARVESELILSRRSLVQAYLEEQDQYQVGGPGIPGDATRHFGIGILLGLASDDPMRDRIRPHLVSGRLPAAGASRIELVLGLGAFENYLSPAERANLSAWPPRAAELEAFGFEATAGYVDDSGFFKDIVRRPAVVVGLFETGLDALDTLTVVGDIGAARLLQGAQASGGANVVTVVGATGHARDAASAQGWHAEDGASFADRYLGQLLTTVRALSLLAVTLFLLVPSFLLWHGLQQTLDRQRREIAVCRAIGIERGELASALARLAWRVAATGLAAALLVAGLLQWALPPLLRGHALLPLPMDFALDWGVAAVALALVAASTWTAQLLAGRAGSRQPLAMALRAA
ncbi:MAG TPA: FtsX-like permease family protein [Candidatus Thermoplasmatota archaeon]|nr:FtsX-like permease family protein [Candidatus Thermoplasmatota archaeon]